MLSYVKYGMEIEGVFLLAKLLASTSGYFKNNCHTPVHPEQTCFVW